MLWIFQLSRFVSLETNNVYDVNVDSNEMQRLNPIEGEQINAYYVETCEHITILINYSFFNPLNVDES